MDPEKRLGGPGRIRTCDARFRKPTLYPLSYGAIGCVQNLMHNRVHNLSALLAAFSIRISFQLSLVDELKIPER